MTLIPTKLDVDKRVLSEAITDWRRIDIRDYARAVAAATAILERKDIQVQDAERSIVKADPPKSKREMGLIAVKKHKQKFNQPLVTPLRVPLFHGKKEKKLMRKVNLYALILLLLLVQLSVGCSAKYKRDGSRQGWFAELSGGWAVVSANEEWTTHKYSGVPLQAGLQATWIRKNTEIQRIDHNERFFPKSPAFNAKLGFGVSDRLIISL